MTVLKVYQAIANITEALSKEGISKSRKNQQQNYAFRGIDDIYNALASELAKNKLCILPCVLERTCEEKQSAKGNALFYVNVKVAFDFVSAEDGSKHQVITVGEAMDSGDKATNKAMSAAYKYAALMTFCIPTEGDNDTENLTHEIKSAKAEDKKWGERGNHEKMKADATDLVRKIEMCESLDELNKLVQTNASFQANLVSNLPDWASRLQTKIDQCREAFELS